MSWSCRTENCESLQADAPFGIHALKSVFGSTTKHCKYGKVYASDWAHGGAASNV